MLIPKPTNRIVKIIAIVLLANFALINFVFAQGATDPGIKFDAAKLSAAQASEAACNAFSTDLMKATGNNFRAVFSLKPNRTGVEKKCLIIPGSGKVPTSGIGAVEQPPGSAALQTQIVAGKGITQKDILDAYTKDKESEAGWFSKLVGATINAILSVITFFVGMLTFLAGAIFNTAVGWILNQTIPDIVTVGWGIVRDFANMFFILILIIIALAAILRIESYDYRHLLGELVIMAVLVNFSKVIAVTLIHFVDLISIMFAPRDLTEIFAFVYNFTIGDIGIPNGWMSGMLQGFTKLFFAIISLATFLALTGLLVVRLVGLYVLIIFSPLAYVLDILPATKHYAHEWWEYFAKYLIWVPISFFMLRLTILLARTSLPNSDTAFKYVILMAFMWGAVIVAEHAGMVGGKAVVNGIEKAGHWAGHRFTHFAGRKYNEWSVHKFATPTAGKPLTNSQRLKFALVNPVAAFKGYSKRGEQLAHHAQQLAVARGEEGANILLSGATLPQAQFIERAHTNEMLKSLVAMRKEQLADIMVKFENVKGHEGETMRNAAVTAMLANGFTDDVLRMKHFADKYGEIRDVLDEEGNVILDENGKPTKQLVTYAPETINRFFYDYMAGPADDHGHKHGLSEQSMRIIAEDAEKFGKDTHHPEIMGHAVFDTDIAGGKGGFVNTMSEGTTLVPTMGGTMVKERINDPNAKWSQYDLSVGEWKKDGGRGTINTATHGMQPQVFQLKNVVQADGTVKQEYIDQGKMLSQTFAWGSPDAIPGSEKYYSAITGIVGSPQGMREVQHAQQRLRDGMLASQVDDQGRLILQSKNEVRKIIKNLKNANDLGRALYAQKLGIVADQRQNIRNIKYRLASDAPDQVRYIPFNDLHSGPGAWEEKWGDAKEAGDYSLDKLRQKIK